MDAHLDVVSAIDGEHWEYVFDSCVGDLKEVPILSQDMGAVQTELFKRMEAEGPLLEIRDLRGTVKSKGKIYAGGRADEVNHPGT